MSAMTAAYVAFESPAELDAPAVLYAWSRPFRYTTPSRTVARPATTAPPPPAAAGAAGPATTPPAAGVRPAPTGAPAVTGPPGPAAVPPPGAAGCPSTGAANPPEPTDARLDAPS